jgi:hypothetical protein
MYSFECIKKETIMNSFSPVQKVLANLVRSRSLEDYFKFRNPVELQHFRGGVLLNKYKALNDVTNEGKNLIFDTMFNGATQIANNSWFIGLISITSYSALAATDTMASHGGWTEFTSYTGGARVGWGSNNSSGQSVTNSTPATFNINASGTVKGVFITSNSTLNGNTGKLWATALFAADIPVSNGDQLKITYTVSA